MAVNMRCTACSRADPDQVDTVRAGVSGAGRSVIDFSSERIGRVVAPAFRLCQGNGQDLGAPFTKLGSASLGYLLDTSFHSETGRVL
jgi:hypothetical protein